MDFLLKILWLTLESIRTLKVSIDKHYRFTFYLMQIIRILISSTCTEIDGGRSFGDGQERRSRDPGTVTGRMCSSGMGRRGGAGILGQ